MHASTDTQAVLAGFDLFGGHIDICESLELFLVVAPVLVDFLHPHEVSLVLSLRFSEILVDLFDLVCQTAQCLLLFFLSCF